MSDASTERHHREAAERHDVAASRHDELARYWEQHGDPDRAELQRELAAHERNGAELERKWARLVVRTEEGRSAPQPEPPMP